MLRTFFQRAPELKSTREIGLMREAGKIVAEALRLCRKMAQPGVRTIDIDQAVLPTFPVALSVEAEVPWHGVARAMVLHAEQSLRGNL